MDLEPAPSRLTQLIQELTQREGEELQRALDASTALLAGLTRRGRSSRAQGPGAASRGDVATHARAERELERLFAGELARLLELAADSGVSFETLPPAEAPPSHEPRGSSRARRRPISVLARRALARRIEFELDGAEDLGFLPTELGARIRDLARRLRRGEPDAFALRWAAGEVERALESERPNPRGAGTNTPQFPLP